MSKLPIAEKLKVRSREDIQRIYWRGSRCFLHTAR